jgi:hypothetical protein
MLTKTVFFVVEWKRKLLLRITVKMYRWGK